MVASCRMSSTSTLVSLSLSVVFVATVLCPLCDSRTMTGGTPTTPVYELVVQAMCRARINDSCLEDEFSSCLEDCTSRYDNVTSEEDIPRSQWKPSDRLRDIKMVCHEDTFFTVHWNDTNSTSQHHLVYYVIELSPWDERTWVPINVTTESTYTVYNLEQQSKYMVRIRRVDADGQIDVTTSEHEFSTLPDFKQWALLPIDKIRVKDMKLISNNMLEGIIEWEPSPDLPCAYGLVLWQQSSHPVLSEIKKPEEFYKWSEPLSFGLNYSVAIQAKSYNFNNESSLTWMNFTTPTCIEKFKGNLSVCVPETPNKLATNESLNEDDSSLCDVLVYWQKPSALPSYYSLTLAQYSRRQPDYIAKNMSLNVSGEAISGTFSKLDVGADYYIQVHAVAEAGDSETTKTFRNNGCKMNDADNDKSVLSTWLVTFTFLTSAVFIVGFWLFFYRRKKKKKLAKIRAEYFEETLKKRTVGYDSDWADEFGGMGGGGYGETDEFEISREQVLICDVLGEGAFGVVHKGLLTNDTGTPQEVAVKMLRESPTGEEMRQFQKEISMMKSVGRHKNIVSMIGCCTQTTRMLLIVEFCALGDLQNFLRQEWKALSAAVEEASNTTGMKQVPNGGIQYADLMIVNSNGSCRLPSNEYNSSKSSHPSCVFNAMYDIHSKTQEKRLTSADLLSFARQIAIGMEYLSGNRVVHRDLAARNVLVCSDLVVKISDFGLSRDIYEQNIYRKKGAERLPVKWMALESLLHQVYTTQSDVWSFGVLLWEIVTLGGNPYPSTPVNQMFRLLKHGYRMERPPTCNESLYNIMLSCWQEKPIDRPTFSALVKQLDKLLETSSPKEYLNLDLLSDQGHGNISDDDNEDSSSSSDDLTLEN